MASSDKDEEWVRYRVSESVHYRVSEWPHMSVPIMLWERLSTVTKNKCDQPFSSQHAGTSSGAARDGVCGGRHEGKYLNHQDRNLTKSKSEDSSL
eukprot:6759975-Karenia_brevis.AAC.1